MKTWLITGSSSGFGRALAEDVLARGDRVVATARSPQALAELAARAPDRVHVVALDVTSGPQIAAAVADAIARFGGIDVLVNNAGYSMIGAIEETPDAEVRALFETHVFGGLALIRAVLPGMRARRSGTIVQVSSIGGITVAAGYGPYCAAKHALEALAEALSLEVAEHGIRVVIVEPGAFRTALFAGAFRAMPPTEPYAATVGPVRTWSEQIAGTQPGDPVKAARAIVDAVEAGAPTLRLPLGADAVAGIRAKLARVSADVDRTEAVASATAY